MTKASASTPLTLPQRCVDAGRVAFIALLLGVPMIGMQTVDTGGQLGIQTHWPRLALCVALAFAGRLLLSLLMEAFGRRAPRGRRTIGLPGIAPGWLALAGLAAAIILPFLPFSDRYIVDTATTVLIYIMLGWGLNVVVGLAGLLDLGYVAFYAVGAYSYALLAMHFQLSFWLCLPLSGLLAAGFGLLLGYPTLRLRGDYLAIVTLGFGEIIRIVLINWGDLTGGPNGIASIARPSFFGLPFKPGTDEGPTFASFFGLEYMPDHRVIFLYFLIQALAVFTDVLVRRLRKLPIGRAWEAMREDEIACKAMGINATNIKLSAYAIGAMLGGFAGVFFAARQGFISPESFTFNESAIILAIVVLGGMGSQLGVVLAAAVLVLLPELGRQFAEYRMLLFGLAMILIMVWRPAGLLSGRSPSVTLGQLKEINP